MTLPARLADALRFAARPTFADRPMPWGRAAALAVLAVFALDAALGPVAMALARTLDAAFPFLPAPAGEARTLTDDTFRSLVLAPVLEELLFRGWLSGRIAALRFALYGMIALALLVASLFVGPGLATALALAGAGVAIAGAVHWSRTCHRDTEVPDWFIRHFAWFVWGSSLVFGLIHLGNYAPLTHPLGILVVLPQIIGGLLLAYTRTRLGLLAAVAHHSTYNLAAMVLGYRWW